MIWEVVLLVQSDSCFGAVESCPRFHPPWLRRTHFRRGHDNRGICWVQRFFGETGRARNNTGKAWEPQKKKIFIPKQEQLGSCPQVPMMETCVGVPPLGHCHRCLKMRKDTASVLIDMISTTPAWVNLNKQPPMYAVLSHLLLVV